MNTKDLSKKASLLGALTKDELAIILTHHNKKTISDALIAHELIYNATEQNKLTPINHTTDLSVAPKHRDFKFTLDNVIDWTAENNFQLPAELIELKKKARTLEIEPNNQEKPLSENKFHSLLAMALGMAINKFNYDPKGKRNKATGANSGSIKDAIEKELGITLDEETIRNHLKEAAEKFLPEK